MCSVMNAQVEIQAQVEVVLDMRSGRCGSEASHARGRGCGCASVRVSSLFKVAIMVDELNMVVVVQVPL